MAEKCACEIARDGIDEAYRNPHPYHGVLQDVMDAEIDYARMCDICPCRKRRMERGECSPEPEKKRKEGEPQEEEKEPDVQPAAQPDAEEEGEQGDVSLLVTEFDPNEQPDEDEQREVEEEDEQRETNSGLLMIAPQCSCAIPLSAIKQAFDEWINYNAQRKQILEPLREAYKVARANSMTHRYELFS